jgi:ABC-type polysaccharide/polyol phosphate transport system ATPase subunit
VLKHWLRRSSDKSEEQPFWALQDISFTIAKGESVGIIGHNGAGKSTLFRILCGVTEPTEGDVKIYGRFAPLLALGAGFNPELTGRQNVFLNAAIQGFPPKATEQLLPDIIEFSELGDFVDIPVKRYSSGMAARLGFSVAIHTLPDIVFLDEILAVGDAAFQEKSRQRILQLHEEKRTLMLISHAAASIRSLCDRAIWIDRGRLRMNGPTEEVLASYESHLANRPV